MKFFYGHGEGNYIDITKEVFQKCLKDDGIYISADDGERCNIIGYDPYPYILKHILIVDHFNNKYIYSATKEVIIKFESISQQLTNNKSPKKWWNTVGKFITDPKERLNTLQKHLNLYHTGWGGFEYEYPEQLMAINNINETSKVLEIGGNVGRVSHIIQTILNNSKNHVIMECDNDMANKLRFNLSTNGFDDINIETNCLSKTALYMDGGHGPRPIEDFKETEHPVEVGAVVTGIALHVGHFIEDVMTQYAQPRPWILLQEGGGNTYVSSAMPQKRNPGLMNDTRRDASTAITLAMGPMIRAHNMTPGMGDAKDAKTNSEMVRSAVRVLQGLDKILKGIVVSPERALEELNSDWTASQELADVLMRKYKLPFRLGHHFASDVVDVAKAKNIKPLDFPYAEAQRIYRDAIKDYPGVALALPMSEIEFKETLNPIASVQNRQTVGGPQESEMKRMLAMAKQTIKDQTQWVQIKKNAIDNAAKDLDRDFVKLLKVP